MGTQRAPWVSIPWILFLTGCCCTGFTKNYPVRGRVVLRTQEITESYLAPAIVADLDEEHKPIAAARIYLAYDATGEHPVEGYETRSDEFGAYEIDTKDIPPPR